MNKNELFFVVDDIVKILLKADEGTVYEEKFTDLMVSNWVSAADKAFNDVIDLFSKSELNEQNFNTALAVVAYYFDMEIDKNQREIRKITARLYLDLKKKIIKSIGYNLDGTDQKRIDLLTKSQIIFLKNHALDSAVAKEFQKMYAQSLNEKLTGFAFAQRLTEKNKEWKITNKYIEKFGELEYFKGVASHNTQRTSAISTINALEEMGHTSYQFYCRLLESSCPVCISHHGKVFQTSDAIKRRDEFFTAVENNNLDGAKNAIPWVGKGENIKGIITPIHFRCKCRLERDRFIPPRNMEQADAYNQNQKLGLDLTEFNNDIKSIAERMRVVWDEKRKETVSLKIPEHLSHVKEKLEDAFKGCNDDVIKIFNKSSLKLKIEIGNNDSCRSTGEITLSKDASPQTIIHEWGHGIDFVSNSLSKQYEYLKNITNARNSFKKVDNLVETIKKDVYKSFTTEELSKKDFSAFQDVLEGLSNCKIRLRYGHGKSYWKKPYSINRESFAQLTRLITREHIESEKRQLEFLRKYFPELVLYHEKIMKGLAND